MRPVDGDKRTLSRHLLVERDATGRWDVNAPYRRTELATHDDPAYRALTNLVAAEVQRHAAARGRERLAILDIGCGLGFLSRSLAALGHDLVGIDPSEVSIKIARDLSVGDLAGSAAYKELALDAFVADPGGHRPFDIAVANMTLHCVSRLPTFMADVTSILADDGLFLATLPNPDSYLQRREDIDLAGVDLSREHPLEIPFRIHGHHPHPAEVIYFHRPLKIYAATMMAAGLRIAKYSIPKQVGTGKPRDVGFFVAHPVPPGTA